MSVHRHSLLSPDTPLIFGDGGAVYEQLAQTYERHDRGLFILAPSGAGKTHFVKGQSKAHWIDGDDLWMATNAHPDGPWWTEGIERIQEIDQRSDVITIEAKKLGFWIVGASNYFLKPDAIVLPDWETHKQWIATREAGDYDGGATSERLDQVMSHRREIKEWATKGVPEFKTVAEAATALTRD